MLWAVGRRRSWRGRRLYAESHWLRSEDPGSEQHAGRGTRKEVADVQVYKIDTDGPGRGGERCVVERGVYERGQLGEGDGRGFRYSLLR